MVAWLTAPAPLKAFTLDEATYAAARASVGRYWEARLAETMDVSVPEPAVANALRALLVQSMVHTWRYSVGNPYEQFSFPESPDAARVMAEYGLAPVARSMLRTSLTRDEGRYRNWKRGERLVALAEYYRLTGDEATIRQVTPLLRRWVADFGRQLGANGRTGLERGLLARERYSSDIPDQVYGLHSQAVVWEGLRAMAGVWRQTGEGALAATSSALAARLGRGIRLAVAASQRRLDDGSLFVPVSLLDPEAPYDLVVEDRLGSYWNLVMPYALASGIFPPGSRQAQGVQRYLELHGARLLGVVRAGAYALYGRDAYPASGTNHVYNLSVARFLADNDRPDALVLALYGALASAMTPRRSSPARRRAWRRSRDRAPRHVPAAEQRQQHGLPRDGTGAARARDPRCGRAPRRAAACVRDASRVARARAAHRGRERANELRHRVVLDRRRGGCRHDLARDAQPPARIPGPTPAPSPRHPARPGRGRRRPVRPGRPRNRHARPHRQAGSDHDRRPLPNHAVTLESDRRADR